MLTEPRRALLEIWRHTAVAVFRDGAWNWGVREERDSIRDAQLLLCLLRPSGALKDLRLDDPNGIQDDALSALRAMGDSMTIPRRLAAALDEYLTEYADDEGTPVFSSHTSLETEEGRPLTREQAVPALVEAYAVSVHLCLSALDFLQAFDSASLRLDARHEVRHQAARVQTSARIRLDAALQGLHRCFVVRTHAVESDEAQAVLRVLAVPSVARVQRLSALAEQLRGIRAALVDIRPDDDDLRDLDNERFLFECGWAWGEGGGVADKRAEDAGVPDLHATVAVTAAVRELSSQRTRVLGLLDPEQQALVQGLQVRADLTRRFWSTLARFGNASWPLEAVPWTASDGESSEYFSLLIATLTLEDLVERRAPDEELARMIPVLEELAVLGRISRRANRPDDPQIQLHAPGLPVSLAGSDAFGPALVLRMRDYAALLLDAAIVAATATRDLRSRDRLTALADQIFEHFGRRVHQWGPMSGLWDAPLQPFSGPEPPTDPRGLPISWAMTARVVDAHLQAAAMLVAPPLRSSRVAEVAADLLSEAEHMLSREQLVVPSVSNPLQEELQGIADALALARAQLEERPGVAQAEALEVLRRLHKLEIARRDAAPRG
ncbi:SCO2524 family protein [Actinospica robiniae]|uniref:SCO2524 family protein n=1 Tax=Actinospica robiniae TaxID=304901 RepID=UPI0004075C4A|nr:SCO2524 family protein [Actinospica robiniae]